MTVINSVLGPLETSELGFTLTHEHVWQSAAGINNTYPEFFDRADVIERAVSLLTEARNEGVQTIVDVTTLDLGRDIRLTEDVSRRTGVNVIAATGFWVDIPRIFWEADPTEVAQLFIKEIQEGIEDTGIKAGISGTEGRGPGAEANGRPHHHPYPCYEQDRRVAGQCFRIGRREPEQGVHRPQ